MIAMMGKMLPMLVVMMFVVYLMVVHVKVMLTVSDHEMPTFSLPTPRAAQRSALDWPVAVYSGKRHVLLVKVVKSPVNVKSQKHALTTLKIVPCVGRAWWGVPYVKNVRMLVFRTLKTSLSIALVVQLMKLMLQLLMHFRSLLKSYH